MASPPDVNYTDPIAGNVVLHSLGQVGAAGVASSDVYSAQGVPGGVPMNVTASPMPVDTSGVPYATYGASISGLAIAATATDIFTIIGSSTKKIEVLEIGLGGVATATTGADVVLLKRSTANSGGTSTAPTMVAFDSTDIAASAAVKAYTANPTTGTLAGNLSVQKVVLDITGTVANGLQAVLRPAPGGKPWVLNSGTETLAVNFAGATIAGATVDITITWRER